MGLDLVELEMAIEDEFGIAIPDERFGDCRTVGDLSRIVHELDPAIDTRQIVERVARVVAGVTGLSPAKISAGDRLIEDLGLG